MNDTDSLISAGTRRRLVSSIHVPHRSPPGRCKGGLCRPARRTLAGVCGSPKLQEFRGHHGGRIGEIVGQTISFSEHLVSGQRFNPGSGYDTVGAVELGREGSGSPGQVGTARPMTTGQVPVHGACTGWPTAPAVGGKRCPLPSATASVPRRAPPSSH